MSSIPGKTGPVGNTTGQLLTLNTRALQAGLNAVGFRVGVDGSFGPQTMAATKRFLLNRSIPEQYIDVGMEFRRDGGSVRITLSHSDPTSYARAKGALELVARQGQNTGAIPTSVANTNVDQSGTLDLSASGESSGLLNSLSSGSFSLSSVPTWAWAVMGIGLVVGGAIILKKRK